MLHIALVEDDADFQNMLAEILTDDKEIDLCGVYSTAEDFMADISRTVVDVVVMDIQLPGATGIECVRKIKLNHPKIQFVMCSVFEDSDQLFESLKAGAAGYILKYRAAEDIVGAVKDIHRGGSPLSPAIARKMVAEFQKKNKPKVPQTAGLTNREQEILELLSQGFRYKEIAAKKFISEETVRTHIRNLYEKLQVQSRTEAINKVYGPPEL